MRHAALVVLFAVSALAGCAHQPDYYSTFISPQASAKPSPVRTAMAEPVDCVVYFDTDSAQLRADQAATLDRCASSLASAPVHVALAGHADERGPERHNFDLGMRRGETVERELAKRGVASDRITVTSYGEEHAAVASAGEEQWSRSRRVDVAPRATKQDDDRDGDRDR
jgi:peptidoglycan-associated lipoprotein